MASGFLSHGRNCLHRGLRGLKSVDGSLWEFCRRGLAIAPGPLTQSLFTMELRVRAVDLNLRRAGEGTGSLWELYRGRFSLP